jgi:hypothetical protein
LAACGPNVQSPAWFGRNTTEPSRVVVAIDPIAQGATMAEQSEGRFAPLLGTAALHLWGELPAEIQEKLFEHAVVIGHKREQDESLREQLARFLHDRHPRTQQGLNGAV